MKEGLHMKTRKEVIASVVLGVCGVAAVALAGGDHTCSACHPTEVTLCDEKECASNENCGWDYGGSGTDAWVRAKCVRE